MIPSWRLGPLRLASGSRGDCVRKAQWKLPTDTRGLWHADMIRSAAARPRGAKSATSVLGLVLTRWRLASTDAGRNEALGLHELERRRLQAGTLSGFVEYLCLATAASVECRVVLASRVTSHSNDLNANNSKKNKMGSSRNQVKKKRSRKNKNPQVGALPVQRVRSVCWKKWAAKHEYEELKEGAWLEPGVALLRKKVKEHWTEKHRNVARQIFLEGGWTQKRLRYWMVGRKQVPRMSQRRGNGEARAIPLSRMARSQTGDPDAFRKVEQKART